MFCEKCGHEIGIDMKCNNPLCESNREDFSLKEPEGSESLDKPSFSSDDFNKGQNANSYHQNTYRSTINNDVITSDEFIAFVGVKNTEYYLEKWERYQDNEKFSSWNWAAFFLEIYWLLYRKMYTVAGIVFAINFASYFILGPIAPTISLVLRIGIGVYANQIYIKDSLTKITNIKKFSRNLNSDALYLRLNTNGGTNLVAPLILFGITAFLIIISILIFIAAIGAFFF